MKLTNFINSIKLEYCVTRAHEPKAPAYCNLSVIRLRLDYQFVYYRNRPVTVMFYFLYCGLARASRINVKLRRERGYRSSALSLCCVFSGQRDLGRLCKCKLFKPCWVHIMTGTKNKPMLMDHSQTLQCDVLRNRKLLSNMKHIQNNLVWWFKD